MTDTSDELTLQRELRLSLLSLSSSGSASYNETKKQQHGLLHQNVDDWAGRTSRALAPGRLGNIRGIRQLCRRASAPFMSFPTLSAFLFDNDAEDLGLYFLTASPCSVSVLPIHCWHLELLLHNGIQPASLDGRPRGLIIFHVLGGNLPPFHMTLLTSSHLQHVLLLLPSPAANG